METRGERPSAVATANFLLVDTKVFRSACHQPQQLHQQHQQQMNQQQNQQQPQLLLLHQLRERQRRSGRGKLSAIAIVTAVGATCISLLLSWALHESRAEATVPPTTACFELIYNISVLELQEHPAGNRRAVVAEQNGLLTLVTLPPLANRTAMRRVSTWLDLRKRVVFDGERGLLGFAFHPQFSVNGRFFVSYTCDSSVQKDCRGACQCRADTGCTLGGSLKVACTSNTVLAEYWAGPRPTSATSLNATETRRLLMFARPFNNHNGGQIFFGSDGFLYYASGDGGKAGDPFNFAQKGNTFLGKILRIDVNAASPGRNYSVPPSNPFVNRSNIASEVWALGLRNPWRCDYDNITNTTICGDVGQQALEEINMIEVGGNYGWRNFEGTQLFNPSEITVPPAVPNTPNTSMIGSLKFPVFQYSRSCFSPNIECIGLPKASVIGGVVYRSTVNPCLTGKYLYNDLFGPMWVADVFGIQRSTSRVFYSCHASSPLPCPSVTPRTMVSPFGSIFSWGKDRAGNAYALASSGVYRLLPLSLCGQKC